MAGAGQDETPLFAARDDGCIYLQIRDFQRMLHYADRPNPWIKMYGGLLDEYEFSCLPDASKWHFVGLCLMALKYENKLPFDPEFIQHKINAHDPVDIKSLVDIGFLEPWDDNGYEETRKDRSLRRRMPESVKLEVLREGGYKCAHCGSTEQPHVDHIVPVSRGGNSERSNLQVLCGRCNLKKMTKTMDEFVACSSASKPTNPMNIRDGDGQPCVAEGTCPAAPSQVPAGLAVD